MPISDKYKLIFIHIPKTGGTSIESFFEITEPENFCFYRWDRDQINYLEKFRTLSSSPNIIYEPQHYTLDIIKDLVNDYNKYFKFSFVRNPYTRILSEFFWSTGKYLNNINDFNSMEFNNWCINYLKKIDLSHKEPQVKYIDESINFIGKYEDLYANFELLKLRLMEFSPIFIKYKDKKLLHLNHTGIDKTDLIQYILPETKELIYSVYKSDFIAFSYNQ